MLDLIGLLLVFSFKFNVIRFTLFMKMNYNFHYEVCRLATRRNEARVHVCS
ncbi:protein YrbN [Candidatus Baumannia cicadellinicola]|uniref:protein YrbN n=1 Tax=Candidatus Palibaumannia cicadellinicola TaxID=186490 RepID=UPI0011857A71